MSHRIKDHVEWASGAIVDALNYEPARPRKPWEARSGLSRPGLRTPDPEDLESVSKSKGTVTLHSTVQYDVTTPELKL